MTDVSQESRNTRIHRPFEKKYKYNSHEQTKGKQYDCKKQKCKKITCLS